MGSLERKIKRNQIKAALKRQGIKKNQPLSQYRFKTKEELLEEKSNMIVEQMKKSMQRPVSK